MLKRNNIFSLGAAALCALFFAGCDSITVGLGEAIQSYDSDYVSRIVSSYEELLSENEKSIEELSQELESKREAIEEDSSTIEEKNSYIDSLEEEISSLKGLYEAVEALYQSLLEENARLSAENGELASAKETLTSKLEELSSQIESLEEELLLANEKLEDKSAELEKVQSELESYKNSNAELQALVSSLEEKLSSKSLELSAKEEEIAALEESITDLEEQVSYLMSLEEEDEEKIEGLEEELSRKILELEAAEGEKALLEASCDSLLAELQEKAGEIKNLKEKLTALINLSWDLDVYYDTRSDSIKSSSSWYTSRKTASELLMSSDSRSLSLNIYRIDNCRFLGFWDYGETSSLVYSLTLCAFEELDEEGSVYVVWNTTAGTYSVLKAENGVPYILVDEDEKDCSSLEELDFSENSSYTEAEEQYSLYGNNTECWKSLSGLWEASPYCFMD